MRVKTKMATSDEFVESDDGADVMSKMNFIHFGSPISPDEARRYLEI
jgi:hypothetical protein